MKMLSAGVKYIWFLFFWLNQMGKNMFTCISIWNGELWDFLTMFQSYFVCASVYAKTRDYSRRRRLARISNYSFDCLIKTKWHMKNSHPHFEAFELWFIQTVKKTNISNDCLFRVPDWPRSSGVPFQDLQVAKINLGM